jgi:hypothetical protein
MASREFFLKQAEAALRLARSSTDEAFAQRLLALRMYAEAERWTEFAGIEARGVRPPPLAAILASRCGSHLAVSASSNTQCCGAQWPALFQKFLAERLLIFCANAQLLGWPGISYRGRPVCARDAKSQTQESGSPI